MGGNRSGGVTVARYCDNRVYSMPNKKHGNRSRFCIIIIFWCQSLFNNAAASSRQEYVKTRENKIILDKDFRALKDDCRQSIGILHCIQPLHMIHDLAVKIFLVFFLILDSIVSGHVALVRECKRGQRTSS